MSAAFLHRGDAPFDSSVWHLIDEAVVGAAKAQLAARRLLEVEGPYGLGLKVLSGTEAVMGASEGGVTTSASSVVPVASIRASFALPARDIAHFQQTGLPFDLSAVVQAALACADEEDRLIFHGSEALAVPGLLNADGVLTSPLGEWDQPGKAMDSLIAAVSALDAAGFHGPYALALPPARYNLLYRRYPDSGMTELEHVQSLITAGLVKAPALSDSGVLIAAGRQFASIVLGQDLMTGYVGPTGGTYEFFLMETVALRLSVPRAVMVLK